MEKQIKKKLVVNVSKILCMMAVIFANSPCMGKMYEPNLPEKLLR